MKLNQFAFCIVLLLTPLLGLWCVNWYLATSAVYSDLLQYGIERHSEAWKRIIEISEQQVRLVGVPLAIAYGIALFGWGFTLRRQSRDKPP
jgi:hypothetical protein